jgi:hypothetical protein
MQRLSICPHSMGKLDGTATKAGSVPNFFLAK